jgi:hypothetical protein
MPRRAAALRWGPLDLFGCDRERPFARIDHLGLLWLLNGGTVIELHRDRAVLETESGARQCYRRRPVEVGRIVLAWELAVTDPIPERQAWPYRSERGQLSRIDLSTRGQGFQVTGEAHTDRLPTESKGGHQ